MYKINVPGFSEDIEIEIELGQSVIFVGANGVGKSQLGIFIEDSIGLKTHRISANRNQNLNPDVPKISEKDARNFLKYGTSNNVLNIATRKGFRWSERAGGRSYTDDFKYLIQLLFANQTNKAVEILRMRSIDGYYNDSNTLFERIEDIWNKVIPEKHLILTGDSINIEGGRGIGEYSARNLSDGERAIFYLIAQVVSVDAQSILIVDEPEIHLNKSLMLTLWGQLEASRPDCSFVFITHDLDFASMKVASKYVVREYSPDPKWKIEKVPEDNDFDEETITRIVGARRPILFIEGKRSSTDVWVYRSVYPDWTIIPRGSCEEVIHSVISLNNNSALTRLKCCGIIDSDGYNDDRIPYLRDKRIFVLPVSEIENVFLLPSVSDAIAKSEGYVGQELARLLFDLKNKVFEEARKANNLEIAKVNFCKRNIDRKLKMVDLGSDPSIDKMQIKFDDAIKGLSIVEDARKIENDIANAIENQDLEKLLRLYDNKGLLAIAAGTLKRTKRDAFEAWVVRIFGGEKGRDTDIIREEVQKVMPSIPSNFDIS